MNSILDVLQAQRARLEKTRTAVEEAERYNEQAIVLVGGTLHETPATPAQTKTAARTKTRRTAVARKPAIKTMAAGASA
jgi:diphthamide biosynthesis methyltransferase